MNEINRIWLRHISQLIQCIDRVIGRIIGTSVRRDASLLMVIIIIEQSAREAENKSIRRCTGEETYSNVGQRSCGMISFLSSLDKTILLQAHRIKSFQVDISGMWKEVSFLLYDFVCAPLPWSNFARSSLPPQIEHYWQVIYRYSAQVSHWSRTHIESQNNNINSRETWESKSTTSQRHTLLLELLLWRRTAHNEIHWMAADPDEEYVEVSSRRDDNKMINW